MRLWSLESQTILAIFHHFSSFFMALQARRKLKLMRESVDAVKSTSAKTQVASSERRLFSIPRSHSNPVGNYFG